VNNMKMLPEEVEIKKIFDLVVELFPALKVPEMQNVIFENSYRRMGKCTKHGQITFSFSAHTELDCKNEEFVDTVVHELIHYNHFELNHNEEFRTMNNVVRNKVLQKLREDMQKHIDEEINKVFKDRG